MADQLTPEEQDELVERIKLKWLRREIGKATDSLDRGEGIPAEKIFAELEAEHERS